MCPSSTSPKPKRTQVELQAQVIAAALSWYRALSMNDRLWAESRLLTATAQLWEAQDA